MIPNNGSVLGGELEILEQPTKTYKLNINRETISGYSNGIDAMIQAIYKILNTERFEWIIYSWDYGIELNDLYGQDVSYVCPELQRRIEDALLQDSRITSVSDFTFDINRRGIVSAKFKVYTIYGEVKTEKAVNV
jgi:Protein of unknown function (DUF2634).